MDYNVVYTEHAQRDLARLDRSVAQRILKRVAFLTQRSNPLQSAKKLSGVDPATYRYRVGDYRVLFRLDPKTTRLIILVVLRVAHRKDVYRG